VSRGQSLKDRWYAEVIRTRLVNGACRELLSLLAVRHMTDAGSVCVPRAVLAEELGVPPSRISDRILEATTAGLLTRVGGGHNGAVTRYRAALPGPKVLPERVPTRAVKVLPEPVPTGEVAYGSAGTYSEAEGSATAGSIRARAPSVRSPTTTTTTAGDGPPPADRDRGTEPPEPAAAAARAERDGQDRLGDYLDGHTWLSTQVGQGNHRPRARINGKRIR
jgi:hypothetical protein